MRSDPVPPDRRLRRPRSLRLLALAAGLALAAAACRERYFVVPTTGMEPTIERGARIRMEPLGETALARGELIVFHQGKPEELHVRRIVAVGGDRVAIRSKQLILNGEPVSEPFASHVDEIVYETSAPLPVLITRDQMPERTVKEGFVLVLGDNRDNSLDSRFYGDIPVGNVVGRVPMNP